MLQNVSSPLVPDLRVCLPFPEPKQGKLHGAQDTSHLVTTMHNQASYCTAALVSLNNSLVSEKTKQTKFQKAQAKFLFRRTWNRSSLIFKEATESCSSGLPTRGKPPPLHSAASEMLNFFYRSLNNIVRKWLQRILPVQEYITNTGIHFNKQQPSASRITDAQKYSLS